MSPTSRLDITIRLKDQWLGFIPPLVLWATAHLCGFQTVSDLVNWIVQHESIMH